MPRTGHRSMPTVIEGTLYTDDNATGTRVGSEQWFSWLQTAKSFRYTDSHGTFTARRETKQRGRYYWTAYRRTGGVLRKTYLGKAETLTPARLVRAADWLTWLNTDG